MLVIVAGEKRAMVCVLKKVVEIGLVKLELIIGLRVAPAGRRCLLRWKTAERFKWSI